MTNIYTSIDSKNDNYPHFSQLIKERFASFSDKPLFTTDVEDLFKKQENEVECKKELAMQDLINIFDTAKLYGAIYIGLAIRMEGFEMDEVIINRWENFDSKLEYIKNTYDENLNHKFAKGVRIVGFTFADCFDHIEETLIYNSK